MFTVRSSQRGQVLVIFVFAIIGLVGITGLAIDGGNIFVDRRHAQNAADTAALAAALKKVLWEKANQARCDNFNTADPLLPSCSDSIITTAKDLALQNGYSSNLVDNTVNIYNPPIDGPYHDCTQLSFNCYNYVEVIINTNVNTWFARVLGIGQLHNTVEAVALARYQPSQALYGGDALVILAPHSVNGLSGEFVTKGSATINLLGGDVFVNSDGPTSFTETSGCVTFNLNGNLIKGLGGQKTSSCPTAPTLQYDPPALKFPPLPELIDEPAECSMPLDADQGTLAADGYTVYNPGHYSSLPPAKNTRLNSGVYCVDDLVKTNNPNSNFEGLGVFLYIRSGGAFDFQGGAVDLTAMTSGPYAGYLIYVASDLSNYEGNPENCNINAGSGDTITGVIYAPYCNVTINGGSDSVGLKAKLVAYTLLINGSGTLTFQYDDSINPMTPELMNTGLFH